MSNTDISYLLSDNDRATKAFEQLFELVKHLERKSDELCHKKPPETGDLASDMTAHVTMVTRSRDYFDVALELRSILNGSTVDYSRILRG